MGKGSKRITIKQQKKVERKVKQHHKKQRRDARKDPSKTRAKKKDPGIPNMCPFKDDLMNQVEQHRARMEAMGKQQKQRRQEAVAIKRKTMDELAEEAHMKARAYDIMLADKGDGGDGSTLPNIRDTSRKAYFKEFKQVIKAADVVLEVLDGRDPLGCRCTAIEQYILRKDPNKKIILVLNKIDLVPKDVVTRWLKYLRNFFPTIAFKASTQEQRSHIAQGSASAVKAHTDQLNASECLGADALVSLLKNYSRSLNIKTSITVGIIGYPNVGKSSLINSLKRRKAAGVGATPGFTKSCQEIIIDKNVKLIDSPGIVFDMSATDPSVVLRNCVKVETVEDPSAVVDIILQRCRRDDLMALYCIPEYTNTTEFLTHVGVKRGKFLKGGVPDMKAAGRAVIQDWNSGKIRYYTHPPEDMSDVHVGAAIVQSFGQEFNVDECDSVLTSLPEQEDMGAVFMSGQPQFDLSAGIAEQLEMDDEGHVPMATVRPSLKKAKAQQSTAKGVVDAEEASLNPQSGAELKKMQKKLKKAKSREGKKDEEAEGSKAEDEADSDYDFGTDFMGDDDAIMGSGSEMEGDGEDDGEADGDDDDEDLLDAMGM